MHAAAAVELPIRNMLDPCGEARREVTHLNRNVAQRVQRIVRQRAKRLAQRFQPGRHKGQGRDARARRREEFVRRALSESASRPGRTGCANPRVANCQDAVSKRRLEWPRRIRRGDEMSVTRADRVLFPVPLRPLLTLLAVALLFAGGCATRPPNPPIARADPETGYRFTTHERLGASKENLIILAFSGGGTRAAAFAYGVLEALRPLVVVAPTGRRVRLLDEIDVATGVSGGS